MSEDFNGVFTIGQILDRSIRLYRIRDKKYYFNGFSRILFLTAGNWWKTFVINIILYVMMYVTLFIGYLIFIMVITMGMDAAMINEDSLYEIGGSWSFIIGMIIISVVYGLIWLFL